MNRQKLTPEEIDDLFAFCKEQDVPYYDVQIELVDHLATAIEQKWIDKPNLPYEEVLWVVFDQFGVSGFQRIRKAKEKELRKKYNKVLWKNIGEYYKLPKIIMTIATSLILFMLFRLTNFDFRVLFVLIVLCIISLFVYMVRIHPKINRIDLIPGKSFLLFDHLKTFEATTISRGTFGPLNAFFWFILINRKHEFVQINNLYWQFTIAFLITFFGIMMFVMCYHVPKRIKEDFIREFPQFVKS